MRRAWVFAVFATLLVGVLASPAAAQGSLSVTYNTQSHGGPYAPAHVVVAWVEDRNGTFVSTISRWAGVRSAHLVAWSQKAGAGDADAVSGASRISHTAPITATWDLRNRAGQIVPDGTYTIRMELADSNSSTTQQNAQGTFTFIKNTTGSEQTGLSNGGFANVSITYTPGAEPPADDGGGGGGSGSGSDDRADVITGGCAASRAETDAKGLALAVLLAVLLIVARRARARRDR
jgi:hypothetical protein